MHASATHPDPLAALVRLAVRSDDVRRVLAAASLRSGEPLALAGPLGEPSAYAPEGGEGRRALAVARAAACNQLVGAAGWTIVPIVRRSTPLGFLALGAGRSHDPQTCALLELLPDLVAEQLHRISLLRTHRAAFVRRLVSDARLDVDGARREAAHVGLELADAYWPAVLSWEGSAPPLPVVERVAREAQRDDDGSLAAVHDRRVVLLAPDRDGRGPLGWLAGLVERARTLAPSFPVRGIAADGAVELAQVSAEVADLDALHRLGTRVGGRAPVVRSRDYALERLLLEHVGGGALRHFAEQQLGPLLRWDRDRRTDLLGVLEAALDTPRHDQAARRCFMHRNTFRHRLQQATDVLGAPLDDADVRLAVHVALRLRRLASSPVSPPASDGPAAVHKRARHVRRPRSVAASADGSGRRP